MPSVSVDTFLKLRSGMPLYDVRSPGEYAKGHIPGLRSLPLFSDAERAEVGTIYKRQGPDRALLAGLDRVAPKMRALVERVAADTPGRKAVALHCWRGGKRSASVAWLLEFAGYDVYVLEGGYKAYRRQLHRFFESSPRQLLILGGYTGSGKTDILHALAERGEQVVDLEGLARHRGSAFGGLGQGEQPTNEQFENALYDAFRLLDPQRPVWLENESRAIGRVYLPEGLWARMREAPLIHLDIPLELRIERLRQEYCSFDPEQVVEALDRIRKRLGGQRHQRAVKAVEAGDWTEAVRLALGYYDKAYRHGSIYSRSETATPFELPFPADDPGAAAEALIRYARSRVIPTPSTPS